MDVEARHTLSLIAEERLPHPSGALLSSFVTDAVNPLVAAWYVNSRLREDGGEALVSDWSYVVEAITVNGQPCPTPDAATREAIFKRDGGKYCVTGKPGTFWDPLVVKPILPIPVGWLTDKPHISAVLGAFFGHHYRDWWLSCATKPGDISPYSSDWLIRKSAARALARGLVGLQGLQPSMVEYEVKHVLIGPGKPLDIDGSYPLLGDHSRSGLEKVDPRFVGTQARLCKSIQFIQLAKKLSTRPSEEPPRPFTGNSKRQRPRLGPWGFSYLTTSLIHFLFQVWCLFPRKARVAAYSILQKVGRRLYGKPEGHSKAQRLPFGVYLKCSRELPQSQNEFNALKLIEQHTSIPAPAPLDFVTMPNDLDGSFDTYILMGILPGEPLSHCKDVIGDTDLEQMKFQMRDYLAQLRDIPHTVNPAMPICNTLGKAARDTRILGGEPAGSFPDKASFSQVLRFSDDATRRGHKIVFCHADLNPRNILVHQSRRSDGSFGWEVSGIVDWEMAGYYPEYWDNTKALFEGFRWPLRYNDWVGEWFAEFGGMLGRLMLRGRAGRWVMGSKSTAVVNCVIRSSCLP